MRRLLLLIPSLLLAISLLAQTKKEGRGLEFGLILGADLSTLSLETSNWDNLGISDDIYSISLLNRVGPSLGILSMIPISDRLSLSPQAMLLIRDSRVEFDIKESGLHSEVIAPATAVFPLHLVWFSKISSPLQTAFTFGARQTFDFTRPNDNQRLTLKKYSFGLDFGLGVEFQLSKFKLRPDLIYSYGFTNLKTDRTNLQSQSISSLHQQNFSLRFLFYN